MRKMTVCLVVVLISIAIAAAGGELTAEESAVDQVLSSFHRAAAEADGELYFSLLADDAIYIGTDASERWTVDEFKAFAEPHFSNGRGWTYTMTERHISIGPSGKSAWFDEILWNDSYGTCRGSGVLVLVDGKWRLAQYHLTFPIPNELSREFTARIKEHDERPQAAN